MAIFHPQMDSVRVVIVLWQHSEHPTTGRQPLAVELPALEAKRHRE